MGHLVADQLAGNAAAEMLEVVLVDCWGREFFVTFPELVMEAAEREFRAFGVLRALDAAVDGLSGRFMRSSAREYPRTRFAAVSGSEDV